MTSKVKIYLDTSVINFLFADDAPEKKEITIDFFENFIKTSIYETCISDFVIAEIEDTPREEKKRLLLDVVKHYPIEFVEVNRDEVVSLAGKYIDAKIIPQKKVMDAYHIAVCVLNQINYLVSWNYKHLANINKEQKIRQVNIANNYFHELRIITPLELINDES